MHLILTGATGLVGSAALSHLLSLPASTLTKLSILSRSPIPMLTDPPSNHPNVTVITHSDFSTYPPSLLQQLKGADGVIWALGISQTEVSKDDYVKITKDYTLAAAKAFSGLSESFKFVYVSGEGATLTPGRFTPLFGRVKGETEAALLALGKEIPSLRVYSVRPGAVDPKGHGEIWRAVKRRRSGKYGFLDPVVFPPLRVAYPGMVSPTRDLGRVLAELAMGDGERLEGMGVEGEGRTVANVGVRRMAGL